MGKNMSPVVLSMEGRGRVQSNLRGKRSLVGDRKGGIEKRPPLGALQSGAVLGRAFLEEVRARPGASS